MYFCSALGFIFVSCLLLIGAHSQKSQVRQTPRFVKRFEGQAVAINCTADFPGAKTNTWLKGDLRVSQSVRGYRERVSESHETIAQKLTSFLRITNLTECDAGTYYCKVDSMGTITKGEGTEVIVMRAGQNGSSNSINIVLIGVSVVVIAALGIALIIVSVQLRRRTKACIALQRQFVDYITEKSTEYMKINEKKKHRRGWYFKLQSREEEEKENKTVPQGG
ncbi:uncharacterized protein LOC127586087 isoform X2 [Pristis pectinata]|uniref:uncharacterized protein LOC127586087 isoform X2 n=1 Tax=Pristis pectinata TaxID=685728 RepID=UPI00223C95DD|nr:uncharacterized protein LOC127586087 isoform X2 [Pristis pectinata]